MIASILHEEFSRRKKCNYRYSLRSFARDLQTEASLLSKILRGQRSITPRMEERFLGHLGRTMGNHLPESSSAVLQPIQMDAFFALSGWHHFAILELIGTEGFRSDLHWIAKRLNLPLKQITEAVERLERIGYLKRETNQWVDVYASATTTYMSHTNEALKRYQRQILKLAHESVECIAPELRDQTALCLPMSPDLVEEIKEDIRKFRRKLINKISKDGRKTEVYHISFSVYPVTHAV